MRKHLIAEGMVELVTVVCNRTGTTMFRKQNWLSITYITKIRR